MGCCGCTLQTSAIVAAVFGIIESIAGLIAGLAILSAGDTTNYQFSVTNVLFNVILSATIFNAFWLIATVVLIIGIVKQNAILHRVWVGSTSVIMIVDLIHTIIFVAVFIRNVSQYTPTEDGSDTISFDFDSAGFFVLSLLLTAVMRGSIWLWIVNICLVIYTAHRANEIERGGPVHPGQTVYVYGNLPAQPHTVPGQMTYAAPGQTIVIQQGVPSTGMPPTYDNQQTQFGQQPPPQYGQSPLDPSAHEKALPPKN